jgi:hypothetical protein
MTTLLCERRVTALEGARASGEDLWIPVSDLEHVSGWRVRPEGVCRDELCIPIPPGSQGDLLRSDSFNLPGLWRHLGRPCVHDRAGETWLFGEGSAERRTALSSRDAPDFDLPDLNGKTHRLSDYRGRKVLLAVWASW